MQLPFLSHFFMAFCGYHPLWPFLVFFLFSLILSQHYFNKFPQLFLSVFLRMTLEICGSSTLWKTDTNHHSMWTGHNIQPSSLLCSA